MDSEKPANTPPSNSPKPTHFVGIFLAGVILLGVGLVATYFLFDFADPKHVDSDPLPRIPKNAPFIVTNHSVVDLMVEAADLKADDLVFDLGCGDGRIIIAAAAASGCHGIGYDIDAELVKTARENVSLAMLDELVTIEEQDIFKVDLSEADVVMMYVLPWMIKKLIPQFQEMKPGSRIVSHDFGFANTNDIPPDETYEIMDPDPMKNEMHSVYVWIMPLKIP